MSHGFDRAYTKTLPTWRDKWWKPTKTKRKHWSDLEFYRNDPKRTEFRKAWEAGERDFSVLWEIVHGDSTR